MARPIDTEAIAALTEIFRRVGARDPESWARSELQEGIPQLARFLFLRAAWRLVVSEEDPSWISHQIAQSERRPDDPFSGGGAALKALQARGATDDELTDLVRAAQAEILFGLCHLLDDPGELEEEVEHVAWSLFTTDDEGHPIEWIGGLHESVLETDPTGREMRPRGTPR